MTLNSLCDLFDSYYIADPKGTINQRYRASSDMIYSDGIVHSHIDKDGYIDIKSVENADYIIFVDSTGKIFLSIYKFTDETKYKTIIDSLNKLKAQIRTHQDTDTKSDTKSKGSKKETRLNVKINTDGGVYNIDEFKCFECNSDPAFDTSIDDRSNVFMVCKTCGCKYTFVPSKYMALKTKETTYKSSLILKEDD